MKLLGVVAVALVFATPASAMRWLDDPPSPPPVLTLPSDFSVEATGPSGAVVTYSVAATDDPDGELTPSCTPASGSTLAVGPHSFECSATDSDGQTTTGQFNVEITDTTAPALPPLSSISTEATSSSGTPVTFSVPNATDLVDGTITPSCGPAAGAAFPVGVTTVTCTATDAHSNSAAQSFTVTITDTTKPTIGAAPANQTLEATGPAGAVVSYAAPSASDNGDPSPAVGCDPSSGATLAVGTHTITCTARDASGNVSDPVSFTVTVQDTTAPTLALPANSTVEADSSAGKVVTYSASASDIVAGSVPASCSPLSGATLPVGTTTVNCSATDGAGNTAHGSFQVTVTDATGPAFSSVPGTMIVEANGSSGANVGYQIPTAVDTVDGPQPVSCTPAPGTLLALGVTTVQCSASDDHGNGTSASFLVYVVDTTPPTLAVPGPTTVYATTPTGIPETAPALIGYRAAATAKDIVDPNPSVSDNLGSFVEIGVHPVGFVARDASGNARTSDSQLTVLPQPPAGTPPLPVAPPAKLPPDVPNLQIFPGDGFVRLVWGAVSGAADYLVYRSESSARRLAADGHGQLVYRGTARTYTDRGLKNGVAYRYVVVSEDAAGNESAGVAAAARPKLNLLRSPKDGAKLKAPPKLVWARNAEASYYNVQLYRGQAKILSTWPVAASVKLKRTWKYQGRRYTLAKGVYRWYVWPGFGARVKVDYGELLGSNSFQMTR